MLESCAFEGQFLPPLKPEGHWGTFRFHRVLGRSRDLWLVARSEHDGVMDTEQITRTVHTDPPGRRSSFGTQTDSLYGGGAR